MPLCFICFHSDSCGFFACPLYDENKTQDEQICKFFIRNQDDTLTADQFRHFWSHVEVQHENIYMNILEMCRSKMSTISKTNQVSYLLPKARNKDICKKTNKNVLSLTNSSIHWSLRRRVRC
jgi:hypothetical protein